MKPLTVVELITRLRVLMVNDPSVADAIVLSDGCDCIGEAGEIVVEKEYHSYPLIDGETLKENKRYERPAIVGKALTIVRIDNMNNTANPVAPTMTVANLES